MNKSKILKRSLAMILSLMMIFAMIPLSASAAATPVISSLTVEVANSGQQIKAALSGSDYAVEVPASPSITDVNGVTVRVTLAAGSGKVFHAGTDGTQTASEVAGQWTFQLTAQEIAAKQASFDLYDDDVVKVATYTISISVTALERDTDVASVTAANQYGSTVLDGNTYTIVIPYAANSEIVTVKLNSKKSSVIAATQVSPDSATIGNVGIEGDAGEYTLTSIGVTPTGGTKASFTVASEGGASTKVYYINLVKAEAFKSFSVEGERKEAKIDPDNKKVEVYMPYGTVPTKNADNSYSWNFTPSYVNGYESVTVKAKPYPTPSSEPLYTKDFKSGEEVDLKSFANLSTTVKGMAIALQLAYTADVKEAWTVEFDVPDHNPVAEIDSVAIGNYVGTVDNDAQTVTLTVPASVREAASTLLLGVSDNSSVQIVGVGAAVVSGQAGDQSAADDVLGINFEANTLPNEATLRVTAGQANDDNVTEVKDYTLRVITQEAKPAAITSAKLVDAAGKEYAASIGADYTVNFTLPYKYKTAGLADTWKFYYEITSGSVLKREDTDGITTIKASGETIVHGDPIWPQDPFTAPAAKKLVVETSSTNMNKYTVVFKFETASAAAELSGLKLVKDSIAKLSDVTASNSYAAIGTTDLVVTIPARDYDDYTTAGHFAYITGALSDGATLYYIDKDGHFNLVTLVGQDGDALVSKLPWAPNDTTKVTYDGILPTTGATALQLVVVSEGVTVVPATQTNGLQADTPTVYDANFKMQYNGLFKQYSLTVKAAAANTANQIKSVSLYDTITEETVTATSLNYGFTLTVPFHFTKDPLVLSYESDSYEKVYRTSSASEDNRLKTLAFTATGARETGTGYDVGLDLDAETYEAAIKNRTSDDTTTPRVIGATVVSNLVSTPEIGGSSQDWQLIVKVSPADIGSALESVKVGDVTATPDSSNKVTLKLPADTEITHVVPELTLSKNATASVGGTAHVNGTSAYNLTTPITVLVTSEDENHTTTYTIAAELSDEPDEPTPVDPTPVEKDPFSDVKKTSWYYDLVNEAYKAGIIDGYTDGTFKPNNYITRQDFAVMLVRAIDPDNLEQYTEAPFTDVTSNYAMQSIAYLKDKEIVNGYGDNIFKPTDYIRRSEVATIFSKLLKLTTLSTEKFTDDAVIPGWARDAIYSCKAAGIFGGDELGNFNANNNMTRAESAKVMLAVKKLLDAAE